MKRWLYFLLIVHGGIVVGQQTPCNTIAVPVTVVSQSRSVRGLHEDSFIVHFMQHPLAIKSLTVDDGPRRILFVLDTGREQTSNARKAAAKLAAYVISKARAQDSFALITANGVARTIRFDAPKTELESSLNELTMDLKEKVHGARALDTIMEGIGWFREARPGDAIMFIGSELDQSSHAKFSEVARALDSHQIRLLGLQFGSIYAGNYFGGGSYSPNQENLISLAFGSGGFLQVIGDSPWQNFKLTEESLSSLQQDFWYAYRSLTEFYRLEIQLPVSVRNEKLKIDVIDEIRKQAPHVEVLYRRSSLLCTPQNN